MKTRFKISKENKAGLYFTAILHLAVIIILLLSEITAAVRGKEGFLMDFSKQEAVEKAKQEEEFKDRISERLDQLISDSYHAPVSGEIRNIAVDAGIKDDRGTDAEELYKDAERLENELRNGQNQQMEDGTDEFVDMGSQKEEKERKTYKGPSVLSYSLAGRKAVHLKIPAYRGFTGGDVTVEVTVDRAGKVIKAKILNDKSSADRSLRKFAVEAAERSRFSPSSGAPERQTGHITYRFIAQ